MRTIKFRGKKLHNGNWVCGYLTDVDNTPIGKVGIINSKPFSGCEESSMVIAETIGQFTGLYDKNGKEIYEGDIIAILDGDYLVRGSGEVEWLEEWGIWYIDCDVESNNGLGDLKFNYDFEVIGNIYDNKELLTQN